MITDDPRAWCVLMVDDDEDNLGVLEQLMDHLRARYYSAHDGLEALDKLAEFTPTIALIDLSMPNLDGWELLKRMRALPTTEHLPVIAVTAHAMGGDKDRALEAGFTGYLSKPFLFSDLLEEIKRCIAVGSEAERGLS
jgi:CheY-like chemotaxis protein